MKRFLFAGLFLLASSVMASTRFFVLDTPSSLAGSQAHGVMVLPEGGFATLPPLVAVATLEEPVATALAEDKRGALLVGTGHPARIYRLEGGQATLLAQLEADQITSLLIAEDGTVYATTALPATLVAFRDKKLVTLATLSEGNLWDATFFASKLVVAAGNPGRLLALGERGLELLAELPDRHGRCLLPAGGRLLIGTSGKGLILTFDGRRVGVLYDSAFTEIASLTAAPDGTIFAAALTGDPTLGQKGGEGPPGVSTTAGPSSPEKGSAVSEILRVFPQGAVSVLHRLDRDLATTLVWQEGGLWVGTGLEGKLLRILNGAVSLADSVDASQIAKISPSGRALLTQGPVRVLQRQGVPQGTFTSPVLDAGQPARWGQVVMSVRGACRMSFRSGNTQEVGETWSPWSAPLVCGNSLVDAPPARYLQVKLELGPEASQVDRLALAYQQLNLPPQIKELKVYPPGEVYLKTPPPSERIVEVTHPDLSGIFTTLEEDNESQAQLGKKYYRVGFQTVSWKAQDPNDDPLVFTLEIQRQGGPWWLVRKDITSVQLALDTQALADGLYRFRLTAADAPANPNSAASTSQVSSWFVVDNTPSQLTVTREGNFWVIKAQDALSPITIAQFNRDAKNWEALPPIDGLLDSSQETFRLPVEKGFHILSIRVVDDHHNRQVVAVEEGS